LVCSRSSSWILVSNSFSVHCIDILPSSTSGFRFCSIIPNLCSFIPLISPGGQVAGLVGSLIIIDQSCLSSQKCMFLGRLSLLFRRVEIFPRQPRAYLFLTSKKGQFLPIFYIGRPLLLLCFPVVFVFFPLICARRPTSLARES